MLGDDVNTDILQPSRYFSIHSSTRASGILAGSGKPRLDASIIVAGNNFGIGSSRESVVRGLIEAGVMAVAAKTVARIFLRNAINNGLPVFAGFDGVAAVHDGDLLHLDTENHILLRKDSKWPIEPLDPYLQGILEAGGLRRYLA